MRRVKSAFAFVPLIVLSLACGLGPVPCSEARPRRARAIAAYRTLRAADIEEREREFETNATARRYGEDSVPAMAIRAARGDLEELTALEAAIASGDEAGAAEHVREIGYTSLNGNHPVELEELQAAQRAVETCTD
jgi:hypothetical protein